DIAVEVRLAHTSGEGQPAGSLEGVLHIAGRQAAAGLNGLRERRGADFARGTAWSIEEQVEELIVLLRETEQSDVDVIAARGQAQVFLRALVRRAALIRRADRL